MSRYKDSPALQEWQLENEFFMSEFGICPYFNNDKLRERLISEFNLVRQIDPNHPIITTRSNNYTPTWPVREPLPDTIGISVYKRVWDKYITKRYFEYPLPAWFYAFLAGGAELTNGRNTFIHELQVEAWTPSHLGTIKDVSLAEQDKSMDAQRLHHRFEYGRATGMKTIDLWGVEWWYWRKTVHKDNSLWYAAQQEIIQTEAHNQELRKKDE